MDPQEVLVEMDWHIQYLDLLLVMVAAVVEEDIPLQELLEVVEAVLVALSVIASMVLLELTILAAAVVVVPEIQVVLVYL